MNYLPMVSSVLMSECCNFVQSIGQSHALHYLPPNRERCFLSIPVKLAFLSSYLSLHVILWGKVFQIQLNCGVKTD